MKKEQDQTEQFDLRSNPPELSVNPCMLCGEVGRLLGRSLRERTEKAGMNGSYRPFIHTLYKHEGLTQQELSRITHLTAPTVSVTLQKMELNGLITRTPNPEDMRQVRVRLTEKGRELHCAVAEIIRDTEQRALSSITPEEQEVLIELLLKLRNNLLNERSGQVNHETD